MSDASPPANRLLALEQELLAQRQLASGLANVPAPESNSIAATHPVSTNRLLALEQSLQRRADPSLSWSANTWQHLAASLKLSRSYSQSSISSYNNDNNHNNDSKSVVQNRLLALEQSLITHNRNQNGHNNHESQNLSRSNADRHTSVIAQTFDFGEAIDLQYNTTTLSTTANTESKLPSLPTLSSPDPQPAPNPPSSHPPSPIAPLPLNSPLAPTDTAPKISSPPSPPPAPSPPLSNAHSIFDQLGKNMAYATAFDLGTVSLSMQQRFDEFDRRLDEQENASPPSPSP